MCNSSYIAVSGENNLKLGTKISHWKLLKRLILVLSLLFQEIPSHFFSQRLMISKLNDWLIALDATTSLIRLAFSRSQKKKRKFSHVEKDKEIIMIFNWSNILSDPWVIIFKSLYTRYIKQNIFMFHWWGYDILFRIW